MEASSHPVAWRNGRAARYVGRASVAHRRLVLTGGRADRDGTDGTVTVPADAVRSVGIARDGEVPALVVDLAEGTLRIELLAGGWGAAHVLADHIGALRAPAKEGTTTMTTRIAFSARIRSGQRERLAAMLDEGPPFDPRAAGFTRHWVYLGDEDVAFVFEGPDPLTAVRRLSAERELLRKTVRMAGLVHAPRFLGEVYSWEAPADTPSPGTA